MYNRALYVIILREFKRFFRQRSRLVVAAARPLVWLLIFGAGFSQLVKPEGGTSYMQFIMPGILGMTILFSAFFSTISVVWDREFGFLREMLVAPVPRVVIVVGKLLSGTVISVFQGTILLVFVPILDLDITFTGIIALELLMILLAITITASGLLVATFLKSLEGFNVIMNLFVLPIFLLSGALYPLHSLPSAIKWFIYINPLCYGVDAFKHILLSGSGRLAAEFSLVTDIVALILISAIMVVASALSFEQRR